MAVTLEQLGKEMERRIIIYTPKTTMPDDSLLGYNGDPNDASINGTPGEQLLYGSGNSTRYSEFDAFNNVEQEWFKSGQPNTWSKFGSGTDASTSLSNISGGDASIYAGIIDGKSAIRPLAGGNNITVSVNSSDNIITIDSSGGSGVYDTDLDSGLTMPEKVGGYPAGTDVSSLYGDSIVNMFDNLLFPTVDPTYQLPSCVFDAVVTSGEQSLLQMIGGIINVDFTSTLDKGEIDINGNFQDYRSGDASIFFYSDPSSDSLLVDTVAVSNLDTQSVTGFLVNEGEQSFIAYVNYKEGPQPINNKGENVDSPLVPGDTMPLQNITFEGVYPYFATTDDIDVNTIQPLTSLVNLSSIDIWLISENYPINPSRQTVRFPNNFGAVTSFETWNTTTLQWQTSPSNEWDLTSIQVDINGTNVSYREYTYISNSRSTTQVRFIF